MLPLRFSHAGIAGRAGTKGAIFLIDFEENKASNLSLHSCRPV